jgi:hypothetical protein
VTEPRIAPAGPEHASELMVGQGTDAAGVGLVVPAKPVSA